MNHMFELYDEVLGDTLGYHKTLEGALKAMSEAINKVFPGLCQDCKGDETVDFTLKYRVLKHKLKE